MSTNSDDDGWVFDSLVNFLHGAIWRLPVMGFIEEKSVVFDPDSYNNMTDDKEEEFRKIHEEYKALVDYMLTSFMEDLQVTAEQVEQSCRLREQNNKSQPESHITRVALEQLWAAEDFNAFRRLMTRKNIDLQLQSLELLVAKYGILSPSLRPANSDEDQDPNGEEDFLQVVISQILQQDEQTIIMGKPVGTVEESGDVIVPELEKTLSDIPPPPNVSLEDVKVDEEIAADIASVAPEQQRILTAVRRALDSTTDDAEQSEQSKIELPTIGSEEEIERRREYLRAQRDKLVALKKREREKQLNSYGPAAGKLGSAGPSSRPKSAKAAQIALKSPDRIATESSDKTLQARRALAQRLKQELVEK